MAKSDKNTVAAPTKGIFPPWAPIAAGLMVIAAYIGASTVGELALVAYGAIRHWNIGQTSKWLETSTYAQFASSTIVYAIMAAVIIMFVRRYKVSLQGLGLVRPRLRDAGFMLLGAPVYVGGYFVLTVIAKIFFPSLDLNQQQQLGFQPSHQPVAMILTFFSLVIVPPLVEELIMRGFLFTSLLKRYSFIPAAVITSAIFAAAHLQVGSGAPPLWIAAIDTFMLSLVLCYLRFKTGSLWPAIFLHGLKNLVAFLSIFVFSVT